MMLIQERFGLSRALLPVVHPLNRALALASGVTEENVDGFLPYVDVFLVGTGIEASFGVLDPGKVERLHQRISAFRP